MPVKEGNFCSVKRNYITLTIKFEKTWLLLNSHDVKATYQDFFSVIKKQQKPLIDGFNQSIHFLTLVEKHGVPVY